MTIWAAIVLTVPLTVAITSTARAGLSGNILLELAERRDAHRVLDVPMSRTDIADYLGLTIETACRVLSALKRDGTISIPETHRIELCDRGALDAVGDA